MALEGLLEVIRAEIILGSTRHLGYIEIQRHTSSLGLVAELTFSAGLDFTAPLGLEVEADDCAPFFARSFSSSSSSSSSLLLTASNLASIQSITFPIVIPFPAPSLIDPKEGSGSPPTDTPC